ncbi:MAG TPA: nickel-dependent hydrogenase large subunit [Candidatus Moranbacteria bacterium]|nr:nickel-dependent hydrogenase large subunit [Candidatus Moranbacteria bacterium]HRZ33356.1 nickel-dependent hydrogenase large subunit [Candidatus Moranbacteria bacterium]
MSLNINYIANIESQTDIISEIIKGNLRSHKLRLLRDSRIIENVIIGRYYKEMPTIVQRICGNCSVSHNMASIKAIEKAMKIEVSEETIKFRKIIECAQFIYSHSFNLFILSVVHSMNIENELQSADEYSEETKKIQKIREYGIEIINLIGGRTIHPLTNEVGGFKKVPTKNEIKNLISKGEEILPAMIEIADFFKNIKLPNFSRPTEYICLKSNGEYAMYDGDVVSNKGLYVSKNDIENNFYAFHRPKEIIKRINPDSKTSYMVGAIARVNNNYDKLSNNAKRYLESLNFNKMDYNPFHNILYKAAEIIHCIEESTKLLREIANVDFTGALTKEYTVQEGRAAAAIEDPRGTLYYWVDIDAKGYIKNINIITPTAQFLSNLEDDISVFIPGIKNVSEKEKEKKIRAFIRAYDPCMGCITR